MPSLKLDKEGYLLEVVDWNEAVATQLAQGERIALTDEHWALIHLVRAFYDKFEVSPAMRPLVKQVREQLGEEKGNSIRPARSH